MKNIIDARMGLEVICTTLIFIPPFATPSLVRFGLILASKFLKNNLSTYQNTCILDEQNPLLDTYLGTRPAFGLGVRAALSRQI